MNCFFIFCFRKKECGILEWERGLKLIMVLIEVVVSKGKSMGRGKEAVLWGWGCPHLPAPPWGLAGGWLMGLRQPLPRLRVLLEESQP